MTDSQEIVERNAAEAATQEFATWAANAALELDQPVQEFVRKALASRAFHQWLAVEVARRTATLH